MICCMSQLARHLLWSQTRLKSLRAIYIPGELNRVANMPLTAHVPRWPMQICISPVNLQAQILCKVREDEEQVLLVALYWHTRTWFSELLLLVTASPWHIPLRKDLLSLFRCPNSIQFQLVSSRFDLILHSILNFFITFSECRHHHAG